MTKINIYRIIILTLAACQLALFSCDNRRNPNLNSRQFRALLTEENASSGQTPVQQLTIPDGYVPAAGVKYRQERDLSVPPARIDIVKGIDHVRNVTLSQIAKEITYINIGKHRTFVRTQITPHGLLVSSFDGVWLYAPDGQLIKEIYKNFCEYEMTIRSVMVKTGDKFKGVEHVRYNEKDDRLWVTFKEEELGNNFRGFLGYIDMGLLLNVSDSEIKHDPVIPLAEFGRGQMSYAEDFVIHQPYGLSNNFLTTNSFFGDTLCRFTFGYDSITAKAAATWRFSVDFGNNYMFREQYTIRNAFSDTLFRITSANKLKPEYLLDLGTSGRATNQGKIDDVKIEQMYNIQSLHEDDNYLYIRFRRNHDSPINRNSKKVHFWWGIYNKSGRDFFTLPLVSDSDPEDKGIENDIDGGLPFWPQEVGGQGEKYMYVSGKNMKSTLTETWFSRSKAQQSDKAAELKQFVQSVDDGDLVIIIVK